MSLDRVLSDPNDCEPETTSAPEIVTISRAELNALRARAEGAMAKEDVQPIRSDSPATGTEAQAGELAIRDRRGAELEMAYKGALRDRDLATALTGRDLLPGAASQLVKLWRDELIVREDDGEFRVSARDGRSVGQAVTDWLASPEYAHFCPPTSRGGIAIKRANRPSGSAVGGAAPKNLGEAVIMRWQEFASRSLPETSTPIGLVRRR